ncbi:hypothetical protein GQ457_06G007230 [Hibiscus cannabinus]
MQNNQQPPRPQPENDQKQDQELSQPQPENDYDQASGQKREHKPVTLELGDEFEPGARSRFRRLKDVHKYMRARKGKQNNQQPHQSQPENNREQVSGQKHERTAIIVHGEQQPKVSHENSAENSNDNHSRKLKQASGIEFRIPNLPKQDLILVPKKKREIKLILSYITVAGLKFSHLQFADDTILFFKPVEGVIANVKRLLRCFEVSSGLKINFDKSCIVGIGVEKELVELLAFQCGCKCGELPFDYLGIPLGADPRKVSTWVPIVERFQSKLSGWRCNSLSFAGRVVLLNSILSSLPIYYLSLFEIPSTVILRLDKIRRKFLWGCTNDKRRIAIVSWTRVCIPKAKGGAGVVNLKIKNRALLAKWGWRFATEHGALWRKLIQAKYCCGKRRWAMKVDKLRTMSTVWRGIVKNWSQTEVVKWLNNDSFKWLVGDGKCILFWEDVWCCEVSLRVKFTRLYRLALRKGAVVAELAVNHAFTEICWAKLFPRPLLERELPLVAALDTLLKEFKLKSEERDKIVWVHEKSGILRKLWLISVAAALWVVWCARNDKIFNKKHSNPVEWMFQSKLRALVWLKTAKGKNLGELKGWWEDPRCDVLVQDVKSQGTSESFRFTVLVSHENSAENSNDNHSRKLKQASGIEFRIPNLPKQDLILVPKESNVELEFEDNVETCRKMEEDEQVITEAEPLSWMPTADHVHSQAQHPLLIDGRIFELPEGWLVEQRPRTSLKYIGKVDKFYYEPGTKRQFRSWKAAQEHVNELKGKQNDQKPPRPQPENDYDQSSGPKHEHKPVTLELGDEFETRGHLVFECLSSKYIWGEIMRLCNISRGVLRWDQEVAGLSG